MAGEPLDFFVKEQFLIEIDGVRRDAWDSMSELSVETATVEVYEGGRGIPHKKPGRSTYADVTLTRGKDADRDLYDWASQVKNAVTRRGLTADDYKRQLDIVQLDLDGSEVARWTLVNAYPNKFVAGDWDSKVDEGVMESVTLSYDYFERTL